MTGHLALLVLATVLIASTAVTASPPAKYDLSVNDILNNVINGVKEATSKAATFAVNTATAIDHFVVNTYRDITKLLLKTANDIRKLVSDGDLITNLPGVAANAITSFTEIMTKNIGDLVQALTQAPSGSRDESSVDQQLLTDALDVHLFLLNQAVVDNTGKLYAVYNGWANQGLVSNLLTALLTSRNTLLDGLYAPVSQLCGIKNDSTGKFAASSKDSVTALLSNIKTTAQSAKDGCTSLLTCSLLKLKAQQVILAASC